MQTNELWTPFSDREAWDPAKDVQEIREHRKRLRAIDPLLDIVWVKPDAQGFPEGKTGRWYFVRWPKEGQADDPDFWVIQTPDGDYCMPQELHYERLREGDMHAHPDVWQRMQRVRAERERQRAKRLENKREEFREKLTERLDHIYDARIYLPGHLKAKLERDQAARRADEVVHGAR